MKRKILKFIIDRAKRSKLVQSVFEQPIDLKQFKIKGSFIDCHGNEHKLYENLRTKIKPGWEKIFTARKGTYDKSVQNIERIVQNGRIAVGRMEPVINLFSGGIKNSTILEVGCSAGGASYSFAEKEALKVVGSEFSGYKISSLEDKEIKQDELNAVNEGLNEIRRLVGARFNKTGTISFVDDDICNSRLDEDSFDIICSWDTLEHLHDPLSAFKNIRKLLKKGGVAIHEYNPFFSLVGGHSACTIDFPWGHVILNEQDFIRFNEQFYPQYMETAISFYLNGINRMTIKDLQDLSKEAGLEILSLLVFPKEQDLRMMDARIFQMAVSNYPNLSLNDMISPRIIVVQRPLTIDDRP
jgi:SAM-dependent methyltransferase